MAPYTPTTISNIFLLLLLDYYNNTIEKRVGTFWGRTRR